MPENAETARTASADYFAKLLGANAAEPRRKPSPPKRATVVTPSTIARVREQQAADAFAAERAALEARMAALAEELEAQKDACVSLAQDLAEARSALAAANGEIAKAIAERDAAAAERERAMASARESAEAVAAESACEVERLRSLLEDARSTSLSTPVLLERPMEEGEKFKGEIREHVLDSIVQAYRAAEAAGRDRRAHILEAVLVANPPSGELEERRSAVKQILKDAGASLDGVVIAALERLGFRYVSGNKHHKLDWAGIRFPLSKTPGDVRSCLNSSAEILNRIF